MFVNIQEANKMSRAKHRLSGKDKKQIPSKNEVRRNLKNIVFYNHT